MDDLPWTKKELEDERKYLVEERIGILIDSGVSIEEAEKLAGQAEFPWLKVEEERAKR